MSLHPALQPYADAWTHSIEAISELVQPLVEAEWNRRTPCPGWSVRDIVSHVLGLDSEMLGDPRPIHTLPRDLYHVTNDHQRYMEMQVDVRRHHTAPEMTSELEYMIIRRNRQLRNESRDPGTKVRGPLGTELTLEEAMRRHAFDVWAHEQDLRTIRVDIQGRGTLESSPALGPAATLTLDWETYFRLACGRVTPEAAADRIKTEGDPDLTAAILRHFTVTQ